MFRLMTTGNYDVTTSQINAYAIFWQLFWGLIISWVAQLTFAGLQLAGHLAGTMIGFAMASIVDPVTQSDNPLIGVFLTWLGLMVFLAFNGHHMILLALAHSFQAENLAIQAISQRQWTDLALQAGQFFLFGLQLVSPVVALLILIDITVALAGKLSPQIPILVISFAVKILTGIMGLGLCLYFFSESMARFFSQQIAWVETWFQTAGSIR
jgi:flagellin-like protein